MLSAGANSADERSLRSSVETLVDFVQYNELPRDRQKIPANQACRSVARLLDFALLECCCRLLTAITLVTLAVTAVAMLFTLLTHISCQLVGGWAVELQQASVGGPVAFPVEIV